MTASVRSHHALVPELPQEVACGFYGKIPARGDFVRAGLPRGFVDAWDDWLQAGLAASRDRLGEAWLPAWLEAPIWRFALAGGVCGPHAALGLWMPSVDRAGRHFPLTLACVAACPVAVLLGSAAGWLDQAERIGLAALEQDTPPEAMAVALAEASRQDTGTAGPSLPPDATTLWWTDGAPRLAGCVRPLPGLPDPACFAALLSDAAA